MVKAGINHSKIETSQKYVHVMEDELRTAMEVASKSAVHKKG